MALRAPLKNQLEFLRFSPWVCVAAIVIFGVIRYAWNPSFWLDEAFVAASLRNPSLHTIFARLDYGQYFPRIYLLCIAWLREAFGYHNPVLRLLPFSSFVLGSVMWAWLLAKRARNSAALSLFAAALLLGATFWLDQAIQLKQYTFDVALSLVPFVLNDDFLDDTLGRGNRKLRLILLALPCALSYPYPIALAARLIGWYLERGRRQSWRLDLRGALVLVAALSAALVSIWLTDHRFNVKDSAAYLAYWDNCIVRFRAEHGIGASAKLIANFLWGWHGRIPLVTAALAPLQVLGIARVLRRWRRAGIDAYDSRDAVQPSRWGSRSLGSIALIVITIAASAFVNYPICAGRATLFAELHLQILAVEGALLVLTSWSKHKLVLGALWVCILITAAYSVRDYARLTRTEPAENLFPLISMIEAEVSDTLWVHRCAQAQVSTLPDALPVKTILHGSDKQNPPPGEKVWVIWAHLDDQVCRGELDLIRRRAKSWQTVYEDSSRGLALVEY